MEPPEWDEHPSGSNYEFTRVNLAKLIEVGKSGAISNNLVLIFGFEGGLWCQSES